MAYLKHAQNTSPQLSSFFRELLPSNPYQKETYRHFISMIKCKSTKGTSRKRWYPVEYRLFTLMITCLTESCGSLPLARKWSRFRLRFLLNEYHSSTTVKSKNPKLSRRKLGTICSVFQRTSWMTPGQCAPCSPLTCNSLFLSKLKLLEVSSP